MNEFITSILEDRKPLIDIAMSLNLTVPGVVAHQSALKNGEWMKIPQYKIDLSFYPDRRNKNKSHIIRTMLIKCVVLAEICDASMLLISFNITIVQKKNKSGLVKAEIIKPDTVMYRNYI